MRIRHSQFLAALALVVVALAAPREAAAQAYVVIVNPAVSDASAPKALISKIFLKQAAKLPSGATVSPIDLAKESPVRAEFTKAVHGRTMTAVETYWQQQIFSGKDVPPASKASDDDVIAFVKSNPGAIGYVSAGASLAGVKAIDVK